MAAGCRKGLPPFLVMGFSLLTDKKSFAKIVNREKDGFMKQFFCCYIYLSGQPGRVVTA